MKVVDVPVGSVVCDSLPFSLAPTRSAANGLSNNGVKAIAIYTGSVGTAVQLALEEELGVIPVTRAGAYDNGASDELKWLQDNGLPKGANVFLDLEGKVTFQQHGDGKLTKLVTDWAVAIAAAGYIPGLYVGVPQPFTSDELWKLPVQRYWRGQGSVRDRNNSLAEPTGCGWCMTQMYPSVMRAGVLVDCNMVGQDYKGRVPNMAVA